MKAGNRVRRELAKCPATAFELGVALGWPMRRASGWCANLLCEGEVKHAGQVRAGKRLSYIYALTEKGQLRLRRDRRSTVDLGSTISHGAAQ
jgi:hypothetical protein